MSRSALRLVLRRCSASLLTLALLALSACSKPDTTPIHVGFMAGLTGRTADLGIGARNGVQLAIEQVNAAGGVHGRSINLLMKDDETNAEASKRVVSELIAEKVAAIIGPMTSVAANNAVPLVNEAQLLMMAGSVATDDLTGKDDQFFRVIASSAFHAQDLSTYLTERLSVRRVSVLVEQGNRAYTASWLAAFSKAFERQGGKSIQVVPYTSGKDVVHADTAQALLQGEPQAVILCTHAVDAALVINQLRSRNTQATIVTTEWAGTGKLTELGGANVEGVLVPQYLNRRSTAPAWLTFEKAYLERFKEGPGFPALVGYNAAQVVITALREQKAGEPLKQTVLRLREFPGLQEPLRFDDFGDVQNKTVLSRIEGGQYRDPH